MPPRNYPNILRFVLDTPWAILPEKLDAICEVVESRILDGAKWSEEEIAARIAGARQGETGVRLEGAVAVIPVYGMLAHRANLLTAMSGGMSTEMLGRTFQAAVADPSISAIVLDVDSPGGSVFGIQELADQMHAARGEKPVVAVANAMAASAAYWIASQADQLLVTPSGLVGSIGVLAAHVDRSKQAEMLGARTTLISAGRYKTEGHDQAPLDDPARAAMQRRVDQYYDAFIRAVARGRGVSRRAVLEGYGEGRVMTARDAKTEGMVDGISTLDDAIQALASGKRRVPLPAAIAPDDDPPLPRPADDVAAFRAQLAALAPEILDEAATGSVES